MRFYGKNLVHYQMTTVIDLWVLYKKPSANNVYMYIIKELSVHCYG